MNFDVRKKQLCVPTDAAGLERLSHGLISLISDAVKSGTPNCDGIHAGLELLRYMLPNEAEFDMIISCKKEE